jgi:ferredoxin
MPKLKNHELVYFTGAIKNTLGFVPGFSKAKQHAMHHDRISFSTFLVDLAESVTPDFFLMDGIMGMEGPGPGQGTPVRTEVLLGSTNPVALDIIASTIAGYDPIDIPTTSIALKRGKWLSDRKEIKLDGPDIKTLIKKDFKRIPVSGNENISFKFLKNRVRFLKKLERRPVFIHENCTGCPECIKICPANAISMHTEKKNHVVLTDSKCIRCFCCSEVCQSNAIEIRRKLFGV